MEKEKEEILIKNRSSRACISQGFRLYMGSFRRIFRYTWLPALVLAIVSGLFSAFYVNEYPRMLIAMQTGQANMLQLALGIGSIMSAGSFLVAVADVVFLSYGFSVLNHHSMTAEIPWTKRLVQLDAPMLWRTTKAVLWLLLIGTVLSLLLTGVFFGCRRLLSPLVAVGLTGLVTIVVAVFQLPLTYVVFKYILNPKLHFASIFGLSYRTGLRHWGQLFVVVLVTVIICAVAWLITNVPAIILYLANIQAQTGLLYGDPLGMPDHMTWLTIGIFTIASFLQAYIFLSILFPLYYAYGSIEAGEAERAKALDQMKTIQ